MIAKAKRWARTRMRAKFLLLLEKQRIEESEDEDLARSMHEKGEC